MFISTLDLNKLFERYPEIFKNYWGPFMIGDGWFPLINDLCSCVSIHSKEKNIEISFLKVQNKFGTLFIEQKGADSFIKQAIRFAERLSYVTCEHCGSKGYLHSSDGTQYGKLITLCDNDALKRFYKRI